MSAWRRWRLPLRLAWRDAVRHRGRSALITAMIALPLIAGTLMLTLVGSSRITPEVWVTFRLGPSAQAVVTDEGCASFQQSPDGSNSVCPGLREGEQPFTEEAVSEVLGASELTALMMYGATLESESAVIRDTGVVEMAEPHRAGEFLDLFSGRAPEEAGEVALSSTLARRLGLGIGDEVSVRVGRDAAPTTVVGLIDPRSQAYPVIAPAGTTGKAWSPTQWLVLGSEPVTWEQVRSANERGWSVFSREVALNPPPEEETFEFLEDEGPDLATVALVGAVLAMGLMELALLVGPAFAIGASRNARQLALIAASGGAPRDVRRIVLATGLVAGALGAGVGIGVGLLVSVGLYVVTATLTDSPLLTFALPTWELPLLAIIAVALGIGAAWIPARTAGRADVVGALAGHRRAGRTSRRARILGMAAAAIGALALVVSVVTAQPTMIVIGVLALELGVVLLTGDLVELVARLAPRFPVAGRFALRDAVRHRHRTAPAAAAVLVAVAAAAAGAVYLEGENRAQAASWVPMSSSPAVIIALESDDLTDSEEIIGEAIGVVEESLDVRDVAPIYAPLAPPGDGSDTPSPSMSRAWGTMLFPELDPDLNCEAGADDVRCHEGMTTTDFASGRTVSMVLVDDGTLLRAAGLPDGEAAVRALAAGGAVVPLEATWPDGTAHLVDPWAGEDDPLVVPAYGQTWRGLTYDMVISPQVAEQLGWEPIMVGAMINTSEEVPESVIDQAAVRLLDIDPQLRIDADRFTQPDSLVTLILVGLAAVVALVAAGLAVGLAQADTRPDLITLAAVGAPPAVRRRVAAAQAGVIVGIGALVGAGTGAGVGLTLSAWARTTGSWGDQWPLAVPWAVAALALVVPLVAMAGAWLLTRSRLPLVGPGRE